MLQRMASIGAALFLVAAAFASPAIARGGHGGHGGGFGGHGGAHFSGGHFGGHVGGVRYGGVRYGGARYGGARVGSYYHGRYAGHYGYRYGRYAGRNGYRYGRYGYPYRRYWPYGAAAVAFAAAWPYYYDDGWPYYYDEGYYAEPPYDSAVAYCMQRYGSYDPRSGTYLGYDGYRHPCP